MVYPLIIGTAGHIDHGKSVLVQAITGQDPDRLPEEKQRGMTIDLGFAFWGEDVAFIDVPGHERLIRNMVAGVSGIDLFLLVIAADEGVKPQTIEHLQILQILGIKEGVVVLTKTDLVDAQIIERRRGEVERLLWGTPLQGSPILPVSALTGQGLEELKEVLRELLEAREKVGEGEIFRLPVDRSFSIKGFGTVVTGTVISGRVEVGEEVELLPAKRPLRIRGIEVMGKPRPEVRRGMRAALNLRGIGKEEIKRGDSLATPSFFQPTRRLEGELSLLKGFPGEVKGGSWLKFLTGTAEVVGRVYPLEGRPLRRGQSGLVRFNLEVNITGALGDRFVVRIPSPPSTIGGGEILDPYPPTKRRGERLDYLNALKGREVPQVIRERLLWRRSRGATENELWQATQLPWKLIRVGLRELQENGNLVRLGEGSHYFLTSSLLKLKERIIDEVKGFHRQNPYRLGVGEDELGHRLRAHLELYRKALQELLKSGELSLHSGRKLALSSHHIPLSPQEEQLKEELEERFLKGVFSPPSPRELKRGDASRLMGVLQEMGALVPTGHSLLFHEKWVKRAEELLREYVQEKGEINLREFKEILHTSRRFALSLLTYFDNQGITRRVGEVRRLR